MLLECNGIRKRYGQGDWVINGLTAAVPEGRIVGVLGPNGCGKTTLIKMICGLLPPDDGVIRIDGLAPGPESAARISYLPERPYFDPAMRAGEMIRYFADFYADFQPETARALLRDLLIDEKALMKTLSKGAREKVQLALVMSRRARLYLLDEPIAGVDPASRDYILQTIIKNHRPDASILITTHLIRDVEEILDDFVFLGYGGTVVRAGAARDVREAEGKSLDELFREVFRYVPQSV